jgi:hypothetical protein
VLTAVVIDSSGAVRVEFVQAGGSGEEKLVSPSECLFEPESEELKNADKIPQSECGPGPSPILPEMKELVWGGGSFIVFALLMRLFLFPRLKRGMDARYNSIREGHENAEATRTAARTEVSQYEAARAAAKAEAAKVLEAARTWKRNVRRRSPQPMPESLHSVTQHWLRPKLPGRQLVRRSNQLLPMW